MLLGLQRNPSRIIRLTIFAKEHAVSTIKWPTDGRNGVFVGNIVILSIQMEHICSSGIITLTKGANKISGIKVLMNLRSHTN